MRILHVNNNVGVGGAQRVMLDLGAHQHRQGHQVITVASPYGEWWPRVAGTPMPLVALGGEHGSALRILRSARALRRAIDTTFPDVIHVHQRPLATAVRIAMIGRRRVPVVEHAHSLATGHRWVTYRWSDAVIAPGREVTRHVTRTYRHAAPRVVCIANAVADPGPAHGVAGRSGPIRLVALGRVVADKDPAWFVDLVAELRSRDLDVAGRWLGDGPDRQRLSREVVERGLPVEFPGRSPIAQLELVAADLVVSSSLLEAMPISLLEALAAGRGIVAREVGSIGELVGDGDNGLLVDPSLPPAEAAERLIERLGSEPRTRIDAWGARSRWRYERSHDPDAIGTVVLHVYETAIAGRARRRATLGQLVLAPVAWVLLHACDLLLRLVGLERALEVVGARGAWTDTASGAGGPVAFAELSPMRRRMAWALQRAGVGWRRSDGPCLRRSLATALVLRKHHPVVHFGVKRGEETPLAHAWVTVGALRFDPDRSYQPFAWSNVA